MYSHLIEKVSCIPSSCYVEKEPDLRPSEIISRIMRDDISFSYASRIRDAYFPNESFEELFVEDNSDDCHLTAADVIRVMDKNPHFGMVVPDAVFSTIRGRVESIAPLYTCEGCVARSHGSMPLASRKVRNSQTAANFAGTRRIKPLWHDRAHTNESSVTNGAAFYIACIHCVCYNSAEREGMAQPPVKRR